MTISRTIKTYTPHPSPKPPKKTGGFLKSLLDIIRRKKLTPEQWKRFWGTIVVFMVGAILAGIFSFVALVAWFAKDIPNPHRLQDRNIAETTKIYDRTGNIVLYEIHGAEKRTSVELADISPHAIHATIAIEDKNFYEHHGFSVTGLLRSVIKNAVSDSRVGGSTITQQFVKNAILTNEKTYTRKLKELILSLEIERRFTKDEILKLYLNEIPYGSVSYGIESASQTFLGKAAKDLTISEAALLAAIPQLPTYYSPYGNNRDALVTRQKLVIRVMLEQGYISQEEADAALADDVLARIQPKREKIIAPHFVFMVREQLAEMYGEQTVEQGGLKVITSIDAKLQAYADESFTKFVPGLAKYNASNAALLSIDPKTGDILAMIGSADYFNNDIDGKFNVLTGFRQPGSSIKPIVYTAAFEKGYTPDTVLDDVKTTFKNLPTDYTPNNYDLGERGPITIKESLAGSLNIPAVKAFYLTGVNKTLNLTSRLGYTTFDPKNMGLSFALGGNEVKPMEHINAFSAFAQEGQLPKMTSILEVKDKAGKQLFVAEHEKKQVMDPEITRQTNSIMSNNDLRAYVFGTKNFLTLPDRQVAAKTGTTNDNKDAWTVGYTPSLVTGVWVGNARKGSMRAGADGSIVAAPIWNDYMRKATKSMPIETFTPPQPVVTGKPILDGQKDTRQTFVIDAVSQKLATENTPEEFRITKTFGVPHSILYYVDKDNPRGPAPENPESDPQFENWEAAVRDWAIRNGAVIEEPPTEFDDVHDPATAPQISIISPRENETIGTRTLDVSYALNSPRPVQKIEFLLDETVFATQTNGTFSGTAKVALPGSIPQGFHRFALRVHNDVNNVGTAWVTINITTSPSKIGLQWINPLPDDTLTGSSFPTTIKFQLPVENIRRVRVTTTTPSGDDTVIGTISRPSLPNFSINWSGTSEFGKHTIAIRVDYEDGSSETEKIEVTIQ